VVDINDPRAERARIATATDLDAALAAIKSRRMLDVASGGGRMVRFLIDRLGGHDEVLAIDRDATVASDFRAGFPDQPRIRFETMDALAMPFEAGAFDVVSMSHALCEFSDRDRTVLLRRLRQLVEPDGALVVSESFRDQGTEPEMTHILLHDWWGDVDAHEGIVHRPFQTRAQLEAQFQALGFRRLRLFEVPDTPGDPHDPAVLEWIDGVIDRSMSRVSGERALESRGIALRKRMHRVGFRIATALVFLGEASRRNGL
jgi:ubiquinone/menaquinone biosynthesis C-methylase UbiE